MSGGTLTAQSIVMGFTGVGTFNQSGGTVTANFVDLNNCGGCNSAGFYNLTGTGQLDVDNINGFNGGLQVGGLGYGYFTENGADTGVTVQGNLSIGGGPIATPNPGDANATPANYNRSGTYELDAGTLSTEFTIVGAGGQGTFLQTGGQHDVTYSLVVGQTNVQQDLGTTCTATAPSRSSAARRSGCTRCAANARRGRRQQRRHGYEQRGHRGRRRGLRHVHPDRRDR